MLKPALLYKDEIIQKFTEYLYTVDYYYYSGWCCGGTFELNEICYLKEYKTWVNISEEIIGEEVEINEG